MKNVEMGVFNNTQYSSISYDMVDNKVPSHPTHRSARGCHCVGCESAQQVIKLRLVVTILSFRRVGAVRQRSRHCLRHRRRAGHAVTARHRFDRLCCLGRRERIELIQRSRCRLEVENGYNLSSQLTGERV